MVLRDYVSDDERDARNDVFKEYRERLEQGRCPDDPGDGRVYNCNSLSCPIHGERNLRLVGWDRAY